MKLSSNVVGDSNDENKLLLTNRQISKFRKGFANNSSTNSKLSKTQLRKMGQSGGFILGSPNTIGPGILKSDIITKPVEELYSFVKSIPKNMGGKILN